MFVIAQILFVNSLAVEKFIWLQHRFKLFFRP